MSKQVILTGLRTNAEYHIGNYIGAILPMVKLAQKYADNPGYQLNLFAPDLHSFTTEIEHSQLYAQTMHNIRLFIASGYPVQAENVFVYRQSFVPAHSELTVILNNFSPYGELSRMTEFKDKSEREENVTAGLFDYPVLMASDILLYSATYIPVGEDQRQHLEFARNLSERINNKFGEIFTVPKNLKEQQEFAGRSEAPRIKSLRDPSKKMSKSVSDPSGTIMLSDSPDEARKKIMRAETDSIGAINYDAENQPGITNLLNILIYLSGRSKEEVVAEFEGSERYGDLKTAVADVVCETLENIQTALSEVDEVKVEAILQESEAAMNTQANAKLLEVQKAVGLR